MRSTIKRPSGAEQKKKSSKLDTVRKVIGTIGDVLNLGRTALKIFKPATILSSLSQGNPNSNSGPWWYKPVAEGLSKSGYGESSRRRIRRL